MTTCATNLCLGFKIFPLWVCLFVCSLVALTALSSEPQTYTADYKLKAVHPGAPDIILMFQLRNPYDYPVKLLWTNVSCACMKPDILGSRVLKPNENRSMKMTIKVPKREMVLGFLVNVYGCPVNDDIPEPTKISDSLEICRIQGRLPILEPVAMINREKRLEVRVSNPSPEFLLENRTGEKWNSVIVEASVQSVTVDCALVEGKDNEQFKCTVNGLHEYFTKAEKPDSIEFTVYKELLASSDNAAVFQQVFRSSMQVTYLPDYRVVPNQLIMPTDGSVASIVIDCSKGDARQLEEEVSVLLPSGAILHPSLWKAHAISDNWIRVQFTADLSTFQDVDSLTVTIPKVYLRDVLSLRKRGNK